jgi:hypothetical protein
MILAILGVSVAACAGDAPPADGVRVTGRIVDAESGLAVPRDHVFVHGFSDDVKAQVSLRPETGTAPFSLDLPTRNVRLRVADTTKQYELWEQTFTADAATLDREVRLVPTHWVLVHVGVRWRDGDKLRPLEEGDGNVRKASLAFSPSADSSSYDHMGSSSYSVRLPRRKYDVLLINTNRSVSPKTFDLSGVAGEETTAEFVLE